MTQTTIPASQVTETMRLASAITHLANGLTRDPNTAPGAIMALELVRELALPKPPAPKRSIVFSRQARRRPDGTWETRDGREGPWSPVPSPAAEPSCDSPHCDCVEGGDCRANVAGGTYEDGEGRIRQLTETQPPAGEDRKASGAAEPFGADPAMWAAGLAYLATVKPQALHGCDTPQPKGVNNEEGYFAQEAYKRATGAPVLGVGITNALGAAAAVRRAFVPAPISDAQQHEADRVMVRAVSPLRVLLPIVSSDHTRTFVLDAASTGHRAPFRPGDLVVQAGAFDAIQRVVEVADDVKGTFCREIHLVVKRADVVVDADAL